MKKDKASKIQYSVFRRIYSKYGRIHKRRIFLSQAVEEDLYILCGYSPDQVYGMVHKIVESISFNPFYGVVINEFDRYSRRYQASKGTKIDKISIILTSASLSFFDFFRKKAQYKVCYYYEGTIIYTANKTISRF